MACATSDLGVLGMAEATSRITAQVVSPVELTDAVLERIRRLNGPLHAYSEVFFEQAMQIAQAREIELRSKLPLGPLHGVPIAVKDLLSIKGFATTSGSTVHRTRIAEDTSTVVRRLIAAGAIIVGKTHLSEFAFGPWGTNEGMGTPWNPWDSETHRAPGGSSSGSAVALAGGMALGAIGTDTGGSVRIPAAFCGLTGLKVTERRVSNAGLSYLSRTLDTIGPMAWSAEDAALLLQVIHGPDPLDPRTLAITSSDFIEGLGQPVKGIRIALPAANRLGPLDPHVERTIEAAMTVFGNLGCHIADLDNTPDFAADQEEAGVIMATEAFVENGEAAESDVAGDPAARGRVLRGRDIPAAHYANAMARRAVRQREFQTLFDSVDVLALPTAPVVASPVADIDEADLSPSRLTRFASYYGLCAIALPGGFTTDGLPLSIQLIAAPYREDLLLRLGVAFQQQTDWHCRRPDLSRFMH